VSSWVVGDIQGCAQELGRLIERLCLAESDRLIAAGDLFHRGPDAAGVMDLLIEARALFVLGNHEHALLRRLGLAPTRPDGSDRPAPRELPVPDAHELRGDRGRPLAADGARLAEILRFVQGHSGYFLEHAAVPGAGPTQDGRPWCVVHAGTAPGRAPRDSRVAELVYPARVAGKRSPWWFEEHVGPALILFGHMVFETPRRVVREGRLVALGLDTGCVYGGRLTAYSPELDRLESVGAARAYVQR
jgi:hypothetical protein